MCQGKAREKWLAKRQADVLPVTYHHLVFTLPHQFNDWATLHPDILYKTLCRHIHLHCLIPSGVLTKEHQWCGSRKEGYLFPVKALSVKFRGKMLSCLAQQAEDGELYRLEPIVVSPALNQTAQLKWNVYSKPMIGHTEAVVGYLARYCNRVGISESRLSLTGNNPVLMRYKDYRTNDLTHMEMSAAELLRRFLLHVLPKGFMRLRYYGFMANSIRRKSLTLIRDSLGKAVREIAAVISIEENEAIGPECPHCHHIGMMLMSITLPDRRMKPYRTK